MYRSEQIRIGARATALIGSVAGGLFADCDALLAGAVNQIPPLVLALDRTGAPPANVARGTRIVQVVLGMMGTVLVIRIIASASHGLFHANQSDMQPIVWLSLVITVVAVLAEVLPCPGRHTGRSSLDTAWRVGIALLPLGAVLLTEHSTWPIDAAVALTVLLMLSIRWLTRAKLSVQ